MFTPCPHIGLPQQGSTAASNNPSRQTKQRRPNPQRVTGVEAPARVSGQVRRTVGSECERIVHRTGAANERPPDVPSNRNGLRRNRAGRHRRDGDTLRPRFLRRSRNESLRLGGFSLAVTPSGIALWLVVILIGFAAFLAAIDPGYVGLMILALLIVLAAVMVHRGTR